MSLYTMTFFGFMPVGALLTGTLASWLGEPSIVMINALVLFGLAIFVWARFPALRQFE